MPWRCSGHGGFALAGRNRSAGPYEQAWLLKTSDSGREQWSRTFGGIGNERGCCLVQAADEGYVLSGYTTSYGGQKAYLVYFKP